MFNFYVYAYLRNDGSPYYIGKGTKSRAWDKHKTIKTPNNPLNIVILEYNLSEIGAFALERRYIHWYGRKDLKNGILRNRTDGGEGGDTISNHHNRLVIVENAKLRTKGEKNYFFGLKKYGIENPFYGKNHTKESIEKIKNARNKQKIQHTQETKNKISESRKNTIKLECPYCGKKCDPGNSKQFHFEKCKSYIWQ